MNGLTTALLGQACRIFLKRAYADGNIPAGKRMFLDLQPDQPLEPLLVPPVCQQTTNPEGKMSGYAFRLGSTWFPHVKLQVHDCGDNLWVFGVDTHDAMVLDPSHPEAARWTQLKEANRRLKLEVESDWETAGLKTFNALLRDGLQAPT